ncbi:hypothetical protein WJX73_000406 [Symbiochloris irregularis]|uniref:Uncharacterized protein n=1 Tax=Symbiochloris irregularis TaxID=706552 RepID=A0AAW1PTY2_9CHLO
MRNTGHPAKLLHKEVSQLQTSYSLAGHHHNQPLDQDVSPLQLSSSLVGAGEIEEMHNLPQSPMAYR